MSVKIAKDLVSEMEASNILTTKEMITKFVMAEDYETGMCLAEAIYRLEAKAEDKGISQNSIFRKGIATLRMVDEELETCSDKKKKKNLIDQTLECSKHLKVQTFHDIFISNANEETELDAVILIDGKILVLEVVNITGNVIIKPDGNLRHSGVKGLETLALNEVMSKKRRLLRWKVEEIKKELGYDVPIFVDSIVVFVSSKEPGICIDNQCSNIKCCFRASLNRIINNYVWSNDYSEKQISQLNEIFIHLGNQVKGLSLKVKFDQIRNDIVEALIMLGNGTDEEENSVNGLYSSK